jgi:hypothetical protein
MECRVKRHSIMKGEPLGSDSRVTQHRRCGFLGSKPGVDGCGGFAAFRDGPDYEGLTTAHVAGGEDAIDGGHVIRVGGDVAALVEGDS